MGVRRARISLGYLSLLMLLWLFSVDADTLDVSGFLSDYVVTEVKSSVVGPNPQRIARSDQPPKKNAIRVEFAAFGEKFDFVATPEHVPQSVKVSVYGKGPEPKVRYGSVPSVYVTSRECKDCVRALGYLVGGVFNGLVSHKGQRYYVEQSTDSTNTNQSTAVVYREKDLHLPKNSCRKAVPLPQGDDTNDKSSSVFDRHQFQKNRSLYYREYSELSCEIEVIADHTLYDMMLRNERRTSAFMYLHAKFADEVFKATPIGLKTIRIIVAHLIVYTDPTYKRYPFGSFPDSIEDYLRQCSYRAQRYCLSVCMCHREFSDNVIGVAYKGDVDMNVPGGICTTPRLVATKDSKFRVGTLNTAVVTTRRTSGRIIPFGVSSRSFVHELGHAFGSEHDPMNNFTCTPGGDGGFYMMYSKSQSDGIARSEVFSTCSAVQMNRVVEAKGDCLKIVEPVCGNAVREKSEECDCGMEEFCAYIDSCCTPSSSRNGSDKACTIRRSVGHSCSPLEGPCCTEVCQYVPANRNKVCRDSTDSCSIGVCTGTSASCTGTIVKPDRSPCRGTSRTCSGGHCNSTICLQERLADCVCRDWENVCKVCCRLADGSCESATRLGFRPYPNAFADEFLLTVGTRCMYGRHQCDMRGVCSDPDNRYFKKKNWFERYRGYIIAAGVFGLLTFLAVLMTFYTFEWRKKRSKIRPRISKVIAPVSTIYSTHQGHHHEVNIPQAQTDHSGRY